MLNKIVLRRTINLHVGNHLADYVKLMISWEYNTFLCNNLAGDVIDLFLAFDKDKLGDKV